MAEVLSEVLELPHRVDSAALVFAAHHRGCLQGETAYSWVAKPLKDSEHYDISQKCCSSGDNVQLTMQALRRRKLPRYKRHKFVPWRLVRKKANGQRLSKTTMMPFQAAHTLHSLLCEFSRRAAVEF